MKKNSKFLAGALATAIFAGGISSCASEETEGLLTGSNVISLAKAPNVVAYSGDIVLGNTFTHPIVTRASGSEVTWEECKTSLIDREREKEIIDEWLPEKNGNLKEGLKTDFLFYADKDLSLEFYPVYSQTNTQNYLGLFYYDTDGEYHEEIVWKDMNPWALTETEWKWSEEKGSYAVVTSKGIQINIPAGYKFGFYWKGNTNTEETIYYSIAEKNEEVYCTDGNGNRLEDEQTSTIHAVTFTLEGKTYLGLEDWTDFDYQDWVFTCDVELKTVPTTPEEEEESPTPEEPGIPAVSGDNHDNEVEVNLHGREKSEDGYLESHLSIHVRYAGDVEIFIPVPAIYYCEADDMAIVMKHEPNYMDHGGPTELTYILKDSDLKVTLKIDFVEADENGDGSGIRIWTEGITQEVIDWCVAKCHGDGITFEIWNYYNDGLNLETLKSYLNQATIKFLDEELPDYYINAFGKDEDRTDEAADCTVEIVEEQAVEYSEPTTDKHLNGSDKNDIYTKKV